MRADKLLMVGVVGLGAYALYRLVTAPKVADAAGAGDALSPASFSPPADSTAVLGDLVGFVQGRWYGGVVDASATPEVLASYGFAAPTVYPNASAAAGKVPPYALSPTTSSTRYFLAPWHLPTQKRPRPPWLPLLWALPRAPIP